MSDVPPNVAYSVKELIGKLDAKLDLVLDGLDAKASTAALDRLDGKIEALGGRISKLETDASVSRATATNTRWMLFTAIPTTASAVWAMSHFLK